MREAQLDEPLVLHLTVEREDVGGVTGLVPVVAIRLDGTLPVPVSLLYLDWSDGTWKASGWSVREAPMAEVSAALAPGVYRRALAALPAGTAPGARLCVEFRVQDGSVLRRATEEYVARETVGQVGWVHAVHHNRQEATPGSPGSLVVYRPDGVTPWKSAELRDYVGAGVAGATGIPARRSGFA
jgi:hypothetical protein